MEENNKDSPLKFYAKYSSLALQMVIIIIAGAFGGKELDEWLQWGFPVFTLVLTILAVVAAIIYGVREIFKQK